MHIQTIDLQHEQAGNYFIQSLHETGFAVIKNHSVDYNLVKKIFAEWQEFFNSEARLKYLFDSTKQDGYVGMDVSETAKGSSTPDIKEFYQVYIPWGRYPTELSNNTLIYFKQIYHLAQQLITWLDKFSPDSVLEQFSEPLTQMMSLERTMLRVLHYPPFFGTENVQSIRAAAHEDINLITLLPASNAMGLQVKTKQDQWIDIGTDEGEIIINVGDMLQECSNHYYVSTTHRVINPEIKLQNTSRFSMPMFVHPRADVFLSDRYKNAEQYLDERLCELGLRD